MSNPSLGYVKSGLNRFDGSFATAKGGEKKILRKTRVTH
jgi:hypothetical protein